MDLERLKMSELMERARALGAPNDVIDECMDQPEVRAPLLCVYHALAQTCLGLFDTPARVFVAQPRAGLIAMLRRETAPSPTPSEDVSYTGQLRERAQALAEDLAELERPGTTATGATVIGAIHAMLELCSSAEADAEAEGEELTTSAEHELAAAGAVEVCAHLLHAALPSGNTPREALVDNVDERPPVAQTATLLLSTLAAQNDAHAWFAGSGAIPALVAALSHGISLIPPPPHDATNILLPPDSIGGEGAIEPLAVSSLANLAFHDGSSEGSSTAVAKEILSVGAVAPLVATLHKGHLRSQQWAAAALCNLSMHGERAREELAASGAFEGVAHAVSRLSAPHASIMGIDRLDDLSPEVVEARNVATELLLGAMSNLAPHRPEDIVEGGAIEAALSVLEHALITTPRKQFAGSTHHNLLPVWISDQGLCGHAGGGNTSALYVAASSLITETTEASSWPSSARVGSAALSRAGSVMSASVISEVGPLDFSNLPGGGSYQPDGCTPVKGHPTEDRYRPASADTVILAATPESSISMLDGSLLTNDRLASLPARLAGIAIRRVRLPAATCICRKRPDLLMCLKHALCTL